MIKKILFILLAVIAGQILFPSFKTTTLDATLVNKKGESVNCTFNWSGVGYGKNLSDDKFEKCIRGYSQNGYILSNNAKIEQEKTILNWLVFG